MAKFFDVTAYGAVANGKDDNSKQFLRAWGDACQWNGNSVMIIPKGIYQLILFKHVDWLLVEGSGTVDGQGAAVWSRDDCKHNGRVCNPLPISMGFNFVKNSKIANLNMINSKSVHLKLYRSQQVMISGVKITAPENSPNTDGINIAESQDIKVQDCNIACGDDCVSMLNGNQNVEVFNVACGPGHGISVGSLGQSVGDGKSVGVTGLHVKNCTLRDIHMENADNPIIIDQHYCPSHSCNNQAQSSIQIKNVTFVNIWGQSSTPVAVNIQCSSKVPCSEFKLQNINLAYNGREGVAKSECLNVHGQSFGQEHPSGCF
ncbi:exopolygalacturonase-like [Apium graveolens]|uniref:exopolygalacturonase-like n=1 Tax=Apium graveolens TaxID=4045 RepID=UPI003D7A0404